MSVIKPESIEYDQELYERLIPRKKDTLYRLYNCHCGDIDRRPIDKSAFNSRELRIILTGLLPDQTEEFLSRHRYLAEENVRTDPAIEYLSETQDIDTEELRIDNRFELLLFLYENDLIEELDSLAARARIREYAVLRGRVFDEELSLTSIHDGLGQFHEEWNNGDEKRSPALIRNEFQSEHILTLKLFLETGPKYVESFSFRKFDQNEVPTYPEVTRDRQYRLKTQRLQLEVGDGKTEVVFTKDIGGWQNVISQFFSTVFNVEDILSRLEPRESTVAKEMESELVSSAKSGGDPIADVQDNIDSRKSAVAAEIDDMELPEEYRDDLKARIETIQISGSNITDDQSIATSRFQLVATLGQLFGTVDGLEEGFRDLIRKADSEKHSFVLTINNRPVEFTGGAWKSLSNGRLRDRDRRALEIFFGQA